MSEPAREARADVYGLVPQGRDGITPWGEARTLRERRLRRGPNVSRGDVEGNQRERLLGSMVAVATTKGYEKTTVADLVEVAGVSRATFYQHFVDKEECFLATIDGVIGVTLEAVMAKTAGAMAGGSNAEGGSSWEDRTQRGVGAFMRLLSAQPATGRLCLVEAHAAGPAAVERVDKALEDFTALVSYVFDQMPERRGMPEEITRAMVGGLRKIVHTRLHRGTEAELAAVVPELTALGLAYRPPPGPLFSDGPKRRRRAPQQPPPPSTGDPAERIVRATMATVAARGYAETAIADLAAAAGISLRTFYQHFESKAAAFGAALDSFQLRLLAAALPVYRRARSWPEAVHGCAQAVLAFLESEPDFALAITVNAYAAGQAALELRDRGIENAQRFMVSGFEDAPQVSPIVREALLSAVFSMLYDRMQSRGPGDLLGMAPHATYMILAPVLGPDEAYRVARDGAG